MKHQHAIVIFGPTASGKTDLALTLAQTIPAEIINADMGQCYTPLNIGTAKPDWRGQSTPHHLFDIAEQPQEISVAAYSVCLTQKIQDIQQRGKIPIIVGGSGFYVQSLWWPPHVIVPALPCASRSGWQGLSPEEQYALLTRIDPERAQALNPHDTYRVVRALTIWEISGRKPSEYAPVYAPMTETYLISIDRHDDDLRHRIITRTHEMLASGWIEEAEALINTDWYRLIMQKNIIGYPEIFWWIENGKSASRLPDLANSISTKTWQYARRQRTYGRSLLQRLTKNRNRAPWHYTTHTVISSEKMYAHTTIESYLQAAQKGSI